MHIHIRSDHINFALMGKQASGTMREVLATTRPIKRKSQSVHYTMVNKPEHNDATTFEPLIAKVL